MRSLYNVAKYYNLMRMIVRLYDIMSVLEKLYVHTAR
jgi:hypothetical protein